MSKTGRYIGGHTLVGPGSTFFSGTVIDPKSKAKVARASLPEEHDKNVERVKRIKRGRNDFQRDLAKRKRAERAGVWATRIGFAERRSGYKDS